ncbi:peptide/nickel transport system ATP-binding protein [Evansella vedderi]|uniref:Peptide/nickel transport system ATP-binding protein n=1 Tax=Evansella vedderi TaxID=38282 RepID=A0ABT9ZU44_9BACI|nr:oligopeptide/dipeptide ABC transporter ATP-binding protein [Evansella vedderi]MDQ0254759.1 peptide/nickel transport system ATP-binding protein [Evansella vedderi]
MKNSIENQPLLEIKGLKKYFDLSSGLFNKEKKFLKAVDGISLEVYPGETLGIVGESGCGKSTTGNVILRLLEATEGQIIFDGKDLSKLSKKEMREKRKDIQMIFQDPFSSLNPRMKVFDIIAEPLRSHKVAAGKELKNRVYELMEVVGISKSFANRYPHEFSGGQRQRIGIARALALKPKLIVCDEPVSALDVSIQSQILNLLSKLQKEFQLTYIFIAHGLPAIKHISDRVAVMYLGKIVELATKDQLFDSPMHPYTEGLLSSVPVPDPQIRDSKERIILEGDLPSPANPPLGCRFHTRCAYADDKCKTEEPQLVEERDGHFVMCHYPLLQGKGVLVN